MNYYGRRRYYSRRYPRRSYRRAYSFASRSKRRAIGNYISAINQQDKTDVNLSIQSKINCFTGALVGLDPDHTGAAAINIWDLLRKSTFYQSYANMYDQIKINSIRLKLTPYHFLIQNDDEDDELGSLDYHAFTIVTAWDRTGLSEEQVYLSFTDSNLETSSVIGTANNKEGLYIRLDGKDLATYSSAVTKSCSRNSNTSIVRTLYPSTITEKSTYVNTADLKTWYTTLDNAENRYYGIVFPRDVRGTAKHTVTDNLNEVITIDESPLKSSISYANSRNPCYLTESPMFAFKPTFLVGILNDSYSVQKADQSWVEVRPYVKFNVEADIGVTFRGLRKAPIVA